MEGVVIISMDLFFERTVRLMSESIFSLNSKCSCRKHVLIVNFKAFHFIYYTGLFNRNAESLAVM